MDFFAVATFSEIYIQKDVIKRQIEISTEFSKELLPC